MRRSFAAVSLACILGAAATSLADGVSAPPSWAFVVNPPNLQPTPDDGSLKRVPNSNAAFTLTQIRNLFQVPDWHPNDHRIMPDIVERGKKPDVFACGYCHLPNGLGRPENASLAGLPAAYIVQQVADFKDGSRRSSEAAHLPSSLMMKLAKAADEADVKEAAAYFSSLPLTPWIKVVEADTVPKTKVLGWMLTASGEGDEAIGQRIIELPENLERTELRDAASGFIAYAPVGSVARGEALARSGGDGKTIQCAVCHGRELKGLGLVPALAGRSPSYLFRQLYDIKHGTRGGTSVALMKAVVAQLSEADMIDLVAYAASLAP